MVKKTELEIKVAVLKELKEECELAWKETMVSSISDDTHTLRGAQQTYNWYVSVSEMLEMYEDLLAEY